MNFTPYTNNPLVQYQPLQRENDRKHAPSPTPSYHSWPGLPQYEEMEQRPNKKMRRDNQYTDVTSLLSSPAVSSSAIEDDSNIGNSDTERNVTRPRKFDVCFGMIIIPMHLRLDALTKINEPLISVLLDYQKDLLVIRNPVTGVYCGLLPPQTGAALMLFRDKHQATLKPLVPVTKSKKGKPETQELLVLVYGMRAVEGAIAGVLDQAGLFLQHPHGMEFLAPYNNPHILCGPGSSAGMMDLAEQPVVTLRQTQTLSENRSLQHQVQQILDSAQGPQVFKEMAVSQLLRTLLKQ